MIKSLVSLSELNIDDSIQMNYIFIVHLLEIIEMEVSNINMNSHVTEARSKVLFSEFMMVLHIKGPVMALVTPD